MAMSSEELKLGWIHGLPQGAWAAANSSNLEFGDSGHRSWSFNPRRSRLLACNSRLVILAVAGLIGDCQRVEREVVDVVVLCRHSAALTKLHLMLRGARRLVCFFWRRCHIAGVVCLPRDVGGLLRRLVESPDGIYGLAEEVL